MSRIVSTCISLVVVPLLGRAMADPCYPVWTGIEESALIAMPGDGVQLDTTTGTESGSDGSIALPGLDQSWGAGSASNAGGTSESTFATYRIGPKIVAILSQRVHGVAGEQATAEGTAYLQIKVTDIPGGGNTARLKVEKYQRMLPSSNVSGEVRFEGVSVPLANVYSVANSTEYDIDISVNAWVPEVLVLNSDVELTGEGDVQVETTLVVSDADCTPEFPEKDDDGLGPFPNAPCAGQSDGGDGLHLRYTTGEIWTVVPLFQTYAEGEIEFDFSLHYGSLLGPDVGGVGHGWSGSFGECIIAGSDADTFIYIDRNGRRNAIHKVGTTYSTPPGRDFEVARTGPIFRVTDSDGTQHIFNDDGTISRIIDRRGGEATFTYGEDPYRIAITSPHGRVVELVYNSDRLLDTVTQPDGSVISLNYVTFGAAQCLANINFPDQTYQSFFYGQTDRCQDHRDECHLVRMVGEQLRDGRLYTADYGPQFPSGIEPDIKMYETVHTIRDSAGNIVGQTAGPVPLQMEKGDRYSVPVQWQRTDGRGNRWPIIGDEAARLVVESTPGSGVMGTTRGYSRVYTYDGGATYDSLNRLTGIKNELNGQRYISYDDFGNITSRVNEEGDIESFTYVDDLYELNHSLLSTRTEAHALGSTGGVWQYEYDIGLLGEGHYGDLRRIIDPAGNEILRDPTYYADGRPGRLQMVDVTDRDGRVTRHEYDDWGNLTQVTQGLGELNLVTQYVYDETCGDQQMGRATRRIVDRGDGQVSVTSWAYDAVGRVVRKIEEMDGVYDTVGSSADLVTQYAWDGCGHLLSVTDPGGVVTKYEYDGRGRLWRTTADYAEEGVEGHLNQVTEWTLDGNGNITDLYDPFNGHTHYDYNARNFLTHVTDAEGYVTTLTVDGAGRVTRMRRQVEGNKYYVVENHYDAINRLLSRIVDASEGGLNLITSYEYTAAEGCGSCAGAAEAKPHLIVDPEQKATHIKYDALNRVTEMIRQVGTLDEQDGGDDAKISYEYDNEGHVTAVEGPEQVVEGGQTRRGRVEFDYDAAGRLTAVRTLTGVASDPANDPYIELRYEYDGAGNVVGLTRADGSHVSMTYDPANRLVEATDDLYAAPQYPEQNLLVGLTYDKNGNVLTRWTGLADQTWTYEYDHLNRVTKSYDPVVEPMEQRYTQYTYLDTERKLLVTDRKGTRTLKEFDALNRLVRLVENVDGTDATANTETVYGYDGVSQRTITDSSEHTTQYEYDGALRLMKVTYPDSSGQEDSVRYEHNGVGNVTQRTDQRGIVTNYTYDDLHHLQTRAYVNGSTPHTEIFEFDRTGRLLSAEKVGNPGLEPPLQPNWAEFTYDRAGRMKSAEQIYADESSYALGYGYTVADGDVHTDVRYPAWAGEPAGRLVTGTLDPRSRLASVFDGVGNGVAWAFDDGNRRISAAMSNGASSAFTYDLNNRLLTIQHGNEVSGALDPFYDVTYGYDAVGNRLYKQDFEEQSRSEVYTYDQRHRLTGFNRGTIQFDPDGAASVVTEINDPQMPSYQNWMPTGTTGLDSRGNWRNFASTIAGQTTTQTRTLDESAGGGGCANEYDRIDIPAGNMGQSTQQLTYDAAGNLIATDLLGDMNCDGLVNTSDRLPFRLAVNNPTGYANTYPDCMIELGDLNADGLVNTTDLNLFANVVSNTLLAARRYEYDEENRLTAITEIDGTALLEIEYDALGRRIATIDHAAALDPCTGAAPASGVDVQTRHIYSGLNTVAEYVLCNGDWTMAREFLWGDNFPEPLVMVDYTDAGDMAAGSAEVLQYVRDALGSVVGLVDGGQPQASPPAPPKMVERYDYDPYGKTYIDTWVAGSGGASGSWARTPASAYGNPFAWTAQRYDASVGMYHFQFRSYSPELGRWMQRDPAGYVDGANLYGALLSQPVRFVDPLGLASVCGDDGPFDGLWIPPAWLYGDFRELRLFLIRGFIAGNAQYDLWLWLLETRYNNLKSWEEGYQKLLNWIRAYYLMRSTGHYPNSSTAQPPTYPTVPFPYNVIPVVGSGGQAMIDYEMGNTGWALVNGALAVGEAVGVGELVVGAVDAAVGAVVRAGAAETATAAAQRLGAEGEAAVRATYNIGPKMAIKTEAGTIIPDGVTEVAVSEVKNVQSLSYTRQLRNYAQHAAQTGRRFDVYVRPGARLSKPLLEARDAGGLRILEIP